MATIQSFYHSTNQASNQAIKHSIILSSNATILLSLLQKPI
ncbi:hypothetical protein [Helicobacter pylori]|nr:hypothetical protein [Helicobacter pylori]